MVKIQRLFAKTNLKNPFFETGKSEFVEESNLLVLNKLERLLTVCFKPKENYTRSELLKVNEK